MGPARQQCTAKPNALISFSELLLKFAKYYSDSSWQGFSLSVSTGIGLVLFISANPAKAGDPTAQISQSRGLHPTQAGDTLTANTLCWLFDMTQFRMTESTFFLPFLLAPLSYPSVHARTRTHTVQNSTSLKISLL